MVFYVGISFLVCCYAQWAEVHATPLSAILRFSTTGSKPSPTLGVLPGCWSTQDFHGQECRALTALLYRPAADLLCHRPAHCLQNKLQLCQVPPSKRTHISYRAVMTCCCRLLLQNVVADHLLATLSALVAGDGACQLCDCTLAM